MALTSSNLLPLNTVIASFTLQNTLTNEFSSLDELKSSIATVVFFICNHCPYVQHIQAELVNVANRYLSKGISFIGISSNDIKAYPEDSPVKMREIRKKWRYPFPYLYDANQSVARMFQAACTPDFYILNPHLACLYHGRFDGSTPNNNIPVTGKDICAALDAILSGEAISTNQKPSMGCSIKWLNSF